MRLQPTSPQHSALSTQHFLVALKGAPGSGKSTLARALSRRLGWPLIDKDDARDVLEVDTSGISYNIMLNVARRQLLQGLSVICDSPLAYRITYERAARIAAETGAVLAVVECRCQDARVLRARIEARQTLGLPSHHTTDWAAVEAFYRRTEGEDFAIAPPHLVVETIEPVEVLCERVVAWLAAL